MGALADVLDRAITRSYKTSPAKTDAGTAALYGLNGYDGRGRQGRPQAALYRYWAEHSEWIFAAEKFIKNAVEQAEWDIVQNDRTQNYDKGVQRAIRDLLEAPNSAVESFESFIGPVVKDVFDIDAGVIEKERTIGGDLVALHAADGARVLVNSRWDGNPMEDRYWWQRSTTNLIPFKNDDLIYMMANQRTFSAVGFSPLEALRYAIDSELNASSYNNRQVVNAAPDGIMDLGEGARPDQVEAFKSYWLAEVAGRGAMAFIGGTKNAKFVPFRQTNRDMQFLEWNIYLVRKICAVCGLSPQDLGVTFDINRATGEVQQDKTEATGVRPTLGLVQRYLTREIVWDKSFKGRTNNLAFRFTRLNIRESKDKADIGKLALAGMPWKTQNEQRMDEGRVPMGDVNDITNPANMLLANTPLGIVSTDDVKSAADVAASQPEEAIVPEPADSKPSASKELGAGAEVLVSA